MNELEHVQGLVGFTTIRCANWDANKELCGRSCGIVTNAADVETQEDVVRRAGWFTIHRGRGDHHHITPFCSLVCLQDWLDREHPGLRTVVDRPRDGDGHA